MSNFHSFEVVGREVGEEFHYVLKFPFFAEQRLLLLGKRIFTHPSVFTFNHVMKTSGTK